jgi:hypothetical protein
LCLPARGGMRGHVRAVTFAMVVVRGNLVLQSLRMKEEREACTSPQGTEKGGGEKEGEDVWVTPPLRGMGAS